MIRFWRQTWFIDFLFACCLIAGFTLVLYTLFYVHETIMPMTLREAEIRSHVQGKIVVQVESQGQAWYVNPDDQKRYALGRPEDALRVLRAFGVEVENAQGAFDMIRTTGIGISDADLDFIPIGSDSL